MIFELRKYYNIGQYLTPFCKRKAPFKLKNITNSQNRNQKQSVPPVLPLFDQPTISAILFYLPEESGAASFLLSFKNGG